MAPNPMDTTRIRAAERTLKALANRRRLAILALLKERGPLPVMNISQAIGLSFWATSKHLRLLAAAELVEHEQRGLLVFYRITTQPPAILKTTFSIL